MATIGAISLLALFGAGSASADGGDERSNAIAKTYGGSGGSATTIANSFGGNGGAANAGSNNSLFSALAVQGVNDASQLSAQMGGKGDGCDWCKPAFDGINSNHNVVNSQNGNWAQGGKGGPSYAVASSDAGRGGDAEYRVMPSSPTWDKPVPNSRTSAGAGGDATSDATSRGGPGGAANAGSNDATYSAGVIQGSNVAPQINAQSSGLDEKPRNECCDNRSKYDDGKKNDGDNRNGGVINSQNGNNARGGAGGRSEAAADAAGGKGGDADSTATSKPKGDGCCPKPNEAPTDAKGGKGGNATSTATSSGGRGGTANAGSNNANGSIGVIQGTNVAPQMNLQQSGQGDNSNSNTVNSQNGNAAQGGKGGPSTANATSAGGRGGNATSQTGPGALPIRK
jgi:hypothetical protein